MASAEEFEEELCLRYGKVRWENMKREYMRENIRLDTESYRDLVNEEGKLYRELSMARKRPEDDFLKVALIEGILDEISENFNVQVEVLDNIRKNMNRLRD